jgi:hypothetical protein
VVTYAAAGKKGKRTAAARQVKQAPADTPAPAPSGGGGGASSGTAVADMETSVDFPNGFKIPYGDASGQGLFLFLVNLVAFLSAQL